MLAQSANEQDRISNWDQLQALSPVVAQLHNPDVLRSRPNRVVYSAFNGDLPVIVKHLLKPEAEQIVEDAVNELQLVGPLLDQGDLQINQYVAHDAVNGVLVVTRVPNDSLQVALDAPTGHRAEILRKCGDWMTRYVGSRISTGSFAPFFWQNQLVDISYKGLAAQDRQLAHEMRQKLRAHADKLRAFGLRRVSGHGDFATHNFGYSNGVLYGFDVQGATEKPLAQELAHFLVLMTMKSPDVTAPRYIGLSEEDVAALCIQSGLPELEYETVFRYFVGWYMCWFMARYAANDARVSALRTMMIRALSDWP